MRAKDFLAEFDPEQFPSSLGPAISVDAHDPPFSRSQLRQMERQNLIVMNKEDTHYRLTLKATKVADLVAERLNSAAPAMKTSQIDSGRNLMYAAQNEN